jgi:hypothetical protein
MYVVKFILNFTSHLNSEQLIPNCGENEFYYKYTTHLEKVNIYSYYYSMHTITTLIVCLLAIVISAVLIHYMFNDDNN